MSPLRLKGIRAPSSVFIRPIWGGCTTLLGGWRVRKPPTKLTQDVFVRVWQKLGDVSRRVVVCDVAAPAGGQRDHRAVS